MSVQVRVMGSLEIVSATGSLGSSDFPSRKARQVFELLTLAKGRTVTKDALLDTLWRRGLPRNPMATVEVAVSLMRTTLARITDSRLVITEPGGYRLDLAIADVDLVSFDELLALASKRPEHDRLGPLREALAFVRGPLLEDEVGAEWLQVQRDRLRRQVEAAQLGLARLALAQGDLQLAHSVAESAWMASDLVLEEAYEVGVVALVQLERTSEARALHAGALRRVAAEDDRPPSPSLEALAGLLQPSPRRAALRGSVTVDPSFIGAPWPLPFIGRSDVLTEIDEAISVAVAGESAVIRVVGPAGMGRSRLLTEVIEWQDRSPRESPTHVLQCRPGDGDAPLLAVGRLMRSIATAAGRPAPMLDDGPTAMFGRFAALLDELGPTVLVVDDLRFADPASVALLEALVGQGGVRRLALVVEQRGVATDRGVSERSLGNEHVVRLGPLRPDELQSLAISTSEAETGGCPWVLATACAAAVGGGEITDELAHGLLAPIEVLGPGATHVLGVASGLSREFDALGVALAARMAVEVVSEVLGRAADAGMVRRLDGDRFEFTADLLRRVLSSTTRAPR